MACGAWSVAMQSIVPSRRPATQAVDIGRRAERRVHLGVCVVGEAAGGLASADDRLVGEREVVRRDLGSDWNAARLRLRG